MKKRNKLEKVVGEVINKKESVKGLMKEKATSYIISKENENGTVYCAFEGHYKDSPKKGDLIEVYLSEDSCVINYLTKRKKLENGYFEFEQGENRYREIKKYKILRNSNK